MEDNKKVVCSSLRVGGQAVMEGVMMKGKEKYAVSVRKPDQTITTGLFKCTSIKDKYTFLKLPILRGVVSFVESMSIGMKTLTYSSEFFLEEEIAQKPVKESGLGKWWQDHQEDILMGFSVVLGIVLALGLFIMLPALISLWLDNFIQSRIVLSLCEGAVRVALFVGYILAISRMKDIQRVFEYHGAEHKTINCMEDGKNLTVENVLPYTRLNRRCGTSFMFLVMFISILFFAVIYVSNPLLKLLYRLLLIPVVAGVSYEVLMLSNKSDSAFMKIVSWPGMMMQKLTTREPDAAEVETAIASTLVVLKAEGRLPQHLEADWERVRSQITLVDGEGNPVEL